MAFAHFINYLSCDDMIVGVGWSTVTEVVHRLLLHRNVFFFFSPSRHFNLHWKLLEHMLFDEFAQNGRVGEKRKGEGDGMDGYAIVKMVVRMTEANDN